MVKTVDVPAHPSNYRKGRVRSVSVAVVHGTVSKPGPPGAVNTGRYFGRDHGSPSSAHRTVDGGGTAVRSVADDDTAYAAPNANANGLHVELCMLPTHDAKAGAAFFASAIGQATLRDAADVLADWCNRYHLPAVWLSPAQLRAGARGLCDHATVSAAYNPGGHWDVGAGLPVSQLLQLVVAAAHGKPVPKAPPVSRPAPPARGRVPRFPGVMQVGSRGAGVKAVQQRLAARGWRITVDGTYGPGTAGVVASFQKDKRMRVDGITGPTTWAALFALPVTK